MRDGYTLRVLRSPAGETVTFVRPPFSEEEVSQLLAKIRQRWVTFEEVRTFGARLFTSFFEGSVRDRFEASRELVKDKGLTLRIQLHLGAHGELDGLPWEYLYDGSVPEFLALSDVTSVVRALPVAALMRQSTLGLPLRILAVIASPADYAPLDAAAEWLALQGTLGWLQVRGDVVLDGLAEATPEALQNQLGQQAYHLLHFIGHGYFDAETQTGGLLFENEKGLGRPVSDVGLASLLSDHPSLTLVVLNASEAGRSSRGAAMGVAQRLVQGGIPAVIGMQFPISDSTAITFTQDFYRALAGGDSLDGALREGRRALLPKGRHVEWGSAVLYLSNPTNAP